MRNKQSVASGFHPGRAWYLVIAFGLVTSAAWADAPRSAVHQAEQLLATGEAVRALESFRELQVDYPEDPAVQFGVACSLLLMGANAVAVNDPQAAAEAYGEARTVFETLKNAAPSAAVRLQAAYNAGNAFLYTGQLMSAEQEYDQKVSMYRQAIAAFEDTLARDSGHGGARQNLDHARFQLKQLLQNPPEKQEQEQQQPPPEQPPLYSIFMNPQTEIPGARAVPEDDDIVRFVPPGGQP